MWFSKASPARTRRRLCTDSENVRNSSTSSNPAASRSSTIRPLVFPEVRFFRVPPGQQRRVGLAGIDDDAILDEP